MINVVSLLEEFSRNPSFRPRMRQHWIFSLIAAVGCFGVMFLINPAASFAAFVIEGVIYIVISRRALETTWGDMRAGVMMSFTRWSLMRQRDMESHVRNWRPHILIFAQDVQKEFSVIQLAYAFSQGRGIITVSSLRTGDIDNLEGLHAQAEENNKILHEKGIIAFCEIDVVNDIQSGIFIVAQANGIAGLQSNTVMIGWPEKEQKMMEIIQTMRRLDKVGKSLILTKMSGFEQREKRQIDIWWAGSENNGDMMLLLAYLLSQSNFWNASSINIKTIVENEDLRPDRYDTLNRLCEKTRIEAQPIVLIKEENENTFECIHQNSKDADLVFLGLKLPQENEEQEFHNRIRQLVGNLSNVVLVRNSGQFRGELLRANEE